MASTLRQETRPSKTRRQDDETETEPKLLADIQIAPHAVPLFDVATGNGDNHLYQKKIIGYKGKSRGGDSTLADRGAWAAGGKRPRAPPGSVLHCRLAKLKGHRLQRARFLGDPTGGAARQFGHQGDFRHVGGNGIRDIGLPLDG